MIDLDVDDFKEVLYQQERLFDAAKELWEDPVVKECVKQFVRGVATTVAIAVARHGYFQVRRYLENRSLDNSTEVM